MKNLPSLVIQISVRYYILSKMSSFIISINCCNKTFFQGNRGGPLLCDNELTGIQTYINDCKQPYLYQRLSAWENLLSCAVQEKCLEEQCSTICFLINKDPVPTTTGIAAVTTDEDNDVMFANEFNNNSSTSLILWFFL